MRPIDADSLTKRIWREARILCDVEHFLNAGMFLEEIENAIKETPTLNAVPVVRCKDCKKCTVWKDGHSFTCHENRIDYYAPNYDAATYYCADGIRREDHGTEKADSQ